MNISLQKENADRSGLIWRKRVLAKEVGMLFEKRELMHDLAVRLLTAIDQDNNRVKR